MTRPYLVLHDPSTPIESRKYVSPAYSGSSIKTPDRVDVCDHCRVARHVSRYRAAGLWVALVRCPIFEEYRLAWRQHYAKRPHWNITQFAFDQPPGDRCTCIAEGRPGYKTKRFRPENQERIHVRTRPGQAPPLGSIRARDRMPAHKRRQYDKLLARRARLGRSAKST